MMGPFSRIPERFMQSLTQTKAQYRRLGGLMVSNPIMGCMGIGKPGWWSWVLGEEKALPLIKSALDCGINTFDTANVYSNGESEVILGKALQKYDIPRRKVVIMTKVGRVMSDGHDDGIPFMNDEASRSKDHVNYFGLSRKNIFESVENSLRRLKTDHIDILHIHRFDPMTPPEETMRALHDLVCMGKVRYIGASSMWAYQLATLQFTAQRNGWTPFISMQNHYNLLYREEEREMNKFCKQNGIGILPWAPLASGHLACIQEYYGKSTRTFDDSKNPRFSYGQSAADKEIISRVASIAAARDWSMTDVSLAWLNKRVTAPIVGMTSVERMENALSGLDKQLTEEEEAYLEEPYIPKVVEGHQ
ncbi:hypothetical protein TWF694_002588 [Orbilia ellipsospora]|uniref:NADP-dependent oxidoreductase domain-containing protein n=1 Tax=Orbilia ellipsospora TaxID=2528407 RepID=A0AAV9X2H4_9PEZI